MILSWIGAAALAQEPMTAEQLEAILTFREEHLEIREIVELVPGRVTIDRWGWGPRPWWGWSWGAPTTVTVDPPEVLRDWAVYQGPQVLSVPAYLHHVDRPELAADLQRRIRRAGTTGDVFSGVGWVGLLGGLTSTVLSFAVPDFEGSSQLATAGAVGTGVGVLSLVVGSAENSRARALTWDYPKTRDLRDVQQQVREHNEALREDLGLTPEQAWRELTEAPTSASEQVVEVDVDARGPVLDR